MDTGMVREAGIRPWSSVDDGLHAVLKAVETGAKETGAFYDGPNRSKAHPRAYDPKIQNRLADLTVRLLGLTGPPW